MSRRNTRYRHQPFTRKHGQASEEGFTCVHCGMYVSCDPVVAGVQNRNHCPYCLRSRHVDLRTPGDRLAGCRAVMLPIGLTVMRSRNKYAADQSGELMLIHRCSVCDTVVINRIAADDRTDMLLELFTESCGQSEQLTALLEPLGIRLLTEVDRALVERRLFGNNPPANLPE